MGAKLHVLPNISKFLGNFFIKNFKNAFIPFIFYIVISFFQTFFVLLQNRRINDNINNMVYRITAPTEMKAAPSLPASKSISNRALIIQALSKENIKISNLSDCDDTRVMVKALNEKSKTIDIGAAGTAMRFLTAYLAVNDGEHILTGTERMKHRPIAPLVNALRVLGADIDYLGEEGFPPLSIRGHRLSGGHLEIAGGISSQYISALLLIAPTMEKGLELRLTGDIVSRPYIDLTLSLMQDFGIKAEWTSFDTIVVDPGNYKGRDFSVENDWSAASYWYEIMSLVNDRNANLTMNGLTDGSMQGDASVRFLFMPLGVRTTFTSHERKPIRGVTLEKEDMATQHMDYDFTEIPDLAQTAVVTCAMLGIPFCFKGLTSLRIKETDRIAALQTELEKLGYVLRTEQDGTLVWDGSRSEPTGEPIDTYEDHRMAMAFAPVALITGNITINNPEVVSKSYPNYWDELRTAGFNIEEI